MRVRQDRPAPSLASGDQVRVLATPEAIEAGVTGLVGEVVGTASPPEAGVSVIGTMAEGIAIQVAFKDKEGAFWFAKRQLEKVSQPQPAPVEAAQPEEVAAKSKPWWRFGL
jgi:hypothetical protein